LLRHSLSDLRLKSPCSTLHLPSHRFRYPTTATSATFAYVSDIFLLAARIQPFTCSRFAPTLYSNSAQVLAILSDEAVKLLKTVEDVCKRRRSSHWLGGEISAEACLDTTMRRQSRIAGAAPQRSTPSIYLSGFVSFVTSYWHIVSAQQAVSGWNVASLGSFFVVEERRVPSVSIEGQLAEHRQWWDSLVSVGLSLI